MDPHAPEHHPSDTGPAQDKAAGHGMVVVGTDRVFFSPLPMFMSPHDYHVILERTFPQQGAYKADRAQQPEGTVFTFNPASFVLPDLFPPAPRRTQFRGDLFRGHFEGPPEFPAEPFKIASGVNVD